MKKQPFFILLLSSLIMLTSCQANTQNVENTAPAGDAALAGDAAPVGDAASTSSNDTEGESSLFIPVPSQVMIVQTTPETGNGDLPIFKWHPVEGASRYMLFLLRENGKGYWSWEGTETEVILGNLSTPINPNASGPRLLEQMNWAIVALDGQDHFIASSPLRAVAP